MEKPDKGGIVPIWPYVSGYERVMREGHLYPAPTCGSPSLVWHMALAPKRRFGDKYGLSEPWLDKDDTPWNEFLQNAYDAYDADYRDFVKQLNTLAHRLQTRRVASEDWFDIRPLPENAEDQQYGAHTHQFLTATPQTLSFTIWWPDPEESSQKVSTDASDRFLRVNVQIQTHTGYATITFIVDASKPYGKSQIETSPEEDTSLSEHELANASSIHADPHRRVRVRRALNIIRCCSLKQVRSGAVEKPRLPEDGVSEIEAKDLLDASEYLYKDIWDEFVEDFDLQFLTSKDADQYELLGERFADFRGHVMSVSGLETAELDKLIKEREEIRSRNAPEANNEQVPSEDPPQPRAEFPDWRPGYGFDLQKNEKPHPVTGFGGFGRFHTFDSARNEGHTVLRSLWPFIRRLSPWADYRELVGCGVMDWRALYVSTLGFGGQGFKHEDEAPNRETDIPNNHLPILERLWRRDPESQETDRIKKLDEYREGSKPVRFLIVTKGEPHREQLGRFIERMTAIETRRIFALRDIVMIRNAGTHLQMIGRMLDGLLEHWSNEREKVEDDYEDKKKELKERWERRDKYFYPVRLFWSFFDVDIPQRPPRIEKKWSQEEEKYIDKLNRLIKETDRHAIRLAAALDGKIGARGAGRIVYAIRRAELAIREFERLLPTLKVGDIDGWTSYPQFVNRGLRPSFDFIQTTGNRLVSIRTRLQTITETIQTAALIAETEATRLNTQTLKEVASFFAHTRWLVASGFAIVIALGFEGLAPDGRKPSQIIAKILQIISQFW